MSNKNVRAVPAAPVLSGSQTRPPRDKKPGTGNPLHTQEPVTVASFRTWRGWRECVARDRCLTLTILTNGSARRVVGQEAGLLVRRTPVPTLIFDVTSEFRAVHQALPFMA